MQKVNRLILVSLLAVVIVSRSRAMEDPNMAPSAPATKPAAATKAPPAPAEYKRADANFYPKAGLLKANPTIVIIPKAELTPRDDSYFFTPKIRAPKNIYFETLNDWIEPITPPGATSLGIASDAMQIREPQGDVEVALPSAPANFSPITDGTTLPNGAVVKTGADGTAAVLFGGVDSARLMPNSAAAVQQTVTANSRSAEVDLTAGGVFSKVGTQIGVKGEYEVHMPFGNAVAHGGDFVTIITSNCTDVWIAQGTVELHPPDAQAMAATSNGTGALKLIRFPEISDPQQSVLADVETFSAILNFIPMANQKIKALRDKAANGVTLTADEQAYLARIKQVPGLIKLALVEPPAPAAPTPPPAPASVPASEMPPPPGPIIPVQINLRADGMVDINGAPMALDDLKSRLADIAKANPTQPLLITGRENVTHDQLKKVIAICHAAKLKVHVAKAAKAPAAPVPLPQTANPAPVAPATNPPAPAVGPAPPPASEPATANPPAPSAASAPTPAPAKPKPIRAVVRVDGKINFQGATYELPGFKSKLEAIIQAKPDQPIVLKVGKTVSYENFQAALEICHSIPVKNLTIVGSPPTPESAFSTGTESPATNLPTPGLLMHPSMEPTSSNAPPEAPSAPPATNAPPPAGP